VNKPPAFQLYARDWAMGTAHLPLDAQGGYMRLLCHQWTDGSLPDVPATLQRLLGATRAKFERLWPLLEPHFPLVPGTATRANLRLESARQKQEEYRARQSIHGAKGGRRVALPEPEGSAKGSRGGEPKGSLSPREAKGSLSPASASASASATATAKDNKGKDLPPVGGRETWLTPYDNLWRKHFSAPLPFGVGAKYLKPLEDAHGSPAVQRALRNYLAAHTGDGARYVSLPKFHDTFGQWLNPTGQKKTREQRNFEQIDAAFPEEHP
jgi:uncharacterized protein YdaU (DUF1376 family)